MSDAVLHEARTERSEELATALGPDFEQQLHRIWERARSVEEVEAELRRLHDSLEDRRKELERVREHTSGLIETRFDESVKQVFRQIAEVLRPAEAALELLQMPCEDLELATSDLGVTPADLDEVVDEELFADQSRTSRADAEAFSRALDQLDQFVEDQLLVLRRRRHELSTQLKQAEEKRDGALGPDPRNQAEERVRRLEQELDEVGGRIEKLTTRDDSDYDRWKKLAHQRRCEQPRAERLFDVEFVIA